MFILLTFQEQSPSGVEEDECLCQAFDLIWFTAGQPKALLKAYYPLVSLNNALLNPEL